MKRRDVLIGGGALALAGGDIVMRFGYGPAMPFSARRAVEAVLA